MDYEFEHFEIGSEALEEIACSNFDGRLIECELPSYSVRALSFTRAAGQGPLLLSFVEGACRGITSQIAVKLAAEGIVEGAMRAFEASSQGGLRALGIVREAFRTANVEVYAYGHRMSMGGQITARGFVAAYDGREFGLGQVGGYEGFIWRQGEIVRFQEGESGQEAAGGYLSRFIGANSRILVDLASVSVCQGDVLVLSSSTAGSAFVERTHGVLDSSGEGRTKRLAQEAALVSIVEGKEGLLRLERNIAVFLLEIGRSTIELSEIYEAPR